MANKQSARRSWASISVLTVLAALVAMALYVPSAAAAPAPQGVSASVSTWAYGGDVGRTVTASGPNGSFAVHYYFAWKVIVTQTNTSSTTFQLEAQRWMVAALFESGHVGTASANLTVNAWENETGFANFTTAATVTTGTGAQVAALGLVDEHGWAAGNITGVLSASWTSATGAPQTGYVYASAAAEANAQLSLAPPLGLYPLAPTTGENWTSMSNFTASGQYAVAWHSFGQVPWGSYSTSGTGSPISVQASGPVYLRGADLGNITLLNGQSATVIVLAISGNGFDFDDHEGIIFLPSAGDIFGAGNSTVSGAPSTATFGTDRVDVNQGRVVSSLSAYSSSSILGATPGTSAQSASIRPAASSAPVSTLQANPMPVSQAQSWCLSNCPATPGSDHGALGGIVLLGLVAAVVVVAAVLLTGRRRRPTAASSTTYPTYAYGAPPTTNTNLPLPPPPPPTNGGRDPVGFYY